MSGTTSWTPAPRGGLIPLQPLGFGTILGKSFAALRGNPKVLLGFAMLVQIVSSVVAIVVIGLVGFATFSRLDTAAPEDVGAISAGSVLITGATALLVTLAMGFVSVAVQGVVIGEVSYAALGERATLGTIWARVKPAFWKLVGYFVLITGALLVGYALLFGVFLALVFAGDAGALLGVGLLFVLMPLLVVLAIFLTTKLVAAPSAIVLEGAGVGRGIARSWSLTRGRFWPTFGVVVLVSIIMSIASSVVTTPLSLLGSLLGALLAPTGGEEAAIVAGVISVFVTAALAFLISSISLVVQATSAALIYLDLRMRKEGIDLRMQRYIERRDAGDSALEDPYAYDPNAVAPWRPPTTAYAGPAPGYPGAAPYGYPAAPYGQPAPYAQPGPYGQQAAPYGQPAGPAAQPGAYGQPAAAPGQPAPPYAPPANPAPPYAAPHPQYAPPYGTAQPGPAHGTPPPPPAPPASGDAVPHLAPFVLPPLDGDGRSPRGDATS